MGLNYKKIRSCIESEQFELAEQLLMETPESDAEWYFLMGVVSAQYEWFDDAEHYCMQACRMDAENVEYQSMYQKLVETKMRAEQEFQEVSAEGKAERFLGECLCPCCCYLITHDCCDG